MVLTRGVVICLWSLLLAGLPAFQAAAGPEIQEWTTENGARVLFVEASDLPMIDVRVVFDAGSARDGDTPGLANMTNQLLTESAGEWNTDQIAERMEAVGAELGRGAGRDRAWVSLRTLTEPRAFETSVETMTVLLNSPRFESNEMERRRKLMLTAVRRGEQKPGTVASKAFYRALFGEHPYATPQGGTLESLPTISREQVVAFYKRHYVAKNALVVIVGALDRQGAEQLAKRLVSRLPMGEKSRELPKVKILEQEKVISRSFPSSQSHILMGQPGMHRGDPDYFVLYLGNHILGGSGLVSLLFEQVREKRGLSYSVYSYFSPMRRDGPFIAGAQTQNAKAREAMDVMRATLKRFIDEGPTEEEVTAAKKNITGGFPLRIASNGKIVGYLAMIGFYGLPLDYLDTFTGRIEAITAEQIQDAFRRRLHPERFVTVVVGDGKAAQPEG